MAFGGDIEMNEIMADDELLPFTNSDSETYSSDEEEVDSVSRKKGLGFVSDEEVVDLVSDEESVDFVSSEEDEGEQTTIRPKLIFRQRLAPLVRPKDEKFQKIENYFFSLLRTPGVSIDDILQGTFDDHEITLITPQSGPPDLVDWQRRNAQRYYENLETRFKGATDTLAFKLACLYFGFPVEPLRMGTLPFLLPPDPEPLDAKKAALNADPLGFLNKYNNDEKFIYDKSILSLRGGGASGFAATKKLEQKEQEQKKKHKKQKINKAIQEVPPKGHEMDIDWFSGPTIKQELVDDDKWINGPTSKKAEKEAKEKGVMDFMNPPSPNLNRKTKKLKSPTTNPLIPAGQLRIYSWQGAMNTSLNYVDFVAAVDRLISNSKQVDRSICVEIWHISPVHFVRDAFGTLRHSVYSPPGSDQTWELIQRYFGQGENHRYACFVRAGDEGEATDAKRPGGYQPPSTEQGVVRIEHTMKKDVAYMRVPKKLYPEHKSHQFSMEYMLAMQVLFSTNAPHAWVLYQHGYIGATYQYLDPPGGLWEQVVDLQSEWSSLPTISFTLNTLDRAVIPVIVPGVFTSRKLPELDRKDFKLANSTQDNTGLGKVYKAIELSLKNVNLKKECSGFEVWCPATDFKHVTQQPTHVVFSGNITNLQSLRDWQGLLSSGVVPDEGFALAVRPVYKTYRLRRFDDDSKVDLQLNEYDLAHFRAFVHNRLYGHYNPKNSSQVLILSAINQESFQAELTIQHNTTEEQWQWIRRNIVEPELIVSVDDLGNEWSIPQNSRWGPRYAAVNNSGSVPTGQDKSAPEPWEADTENSSTPLPDGAPGKTGQTSYASQIPLDFVFKDSRNTIDEAERMQILRDRTFTSVNSIFTNPLKPVMPLHGPPLESIIKTGPSMPGVSIAMMTPTEVLRLQREVHSLRFQLLDRTRECPYTDCDLYFTFSDSDGLDKHIREDHNVLRCFLCDKNQHLLPYYNTDQIKKHFASEHVDDILKAYGQAGAKESVVPERLCDFFYTCGAITTRMTHDQLNEHMQAHDETPEGSDEDVSEEDSLLGSVQPEPIESDTDIDMRDQGDSPPSLPNTVHKGKKNLEENLHSSIPRFVPTATPPDTSSSDSDLSLSPVVLPRTPPKKPAEAQPPTTKGNIWDQIVAGTIKQDQQAVKAENTTPAPGTTPRKVLLSSQAWGPDPAEKKEKTSKPVKSPKQQALPTPVSTTSIKSPTVKQKHPTKSPKPAQREMVPVVDPKTEPDFNIFTAFNPDSTKGTVQDSSQWIKDAVERHIADGGKQHINVDELKFAALRKINRNPGTWQENMAFIKKQMEDYVALGGKLPSDEWPAGVASGGKAAKTPTAASSKKIASPPGLDALLAGLVAQVVDGNTSEEDDGGDEKKKRKRKRDTDAGSGSEVYEYSERSAVSDPPADLAADTPSWPKKQRSGSGGKKAKTPVVTRTGRAVKPSRAAREAAEASPSPSSSDSPSSLSSLDSPKNSGSEESSEFEYEVENIERRLNERK
ncbi:hypothetical protein F4782DRAFT_534003 [Xylaria castorea]|nr:hypothetical protein F4782DRAFT_534003 [Xylaria castorea]